MKNIRQPRARAYLCFALLASLACGGGGTEPVLPADQALMVTADEVLGVATIDRTKEIFSKNRAYDGAVEVSYEYETDLFYLTSTANHEIDADSAGWVYSGANVGLDVVGAAFGEEIKFVDAPGVLTWGDERNCRSLQSQGLDLGVMCVARKGKLVYTFMLTGQSLNSPGAVDLVLADELAAFEVWTP